MQLFLEQLNKFRKEIKISYNYSFFAIFQAKKFMYITKLSG